MERQRGSLDEWCTLAYIAYMGLGQFGIGDIIHNLLTEERGRIVRIVEVGGLIPYAIGLAETSGRTSFDPAQGGLSYIVSVMQTPDRESLWLESQVTSPIPEFPHLCLQRLRPTYS